MATDKERRDVVDRIRSYDDHLILNFSCVMHELVFGKCGVEGYCLPSNEARCRNRTLRRLEDLIEPETKRTCRNIGGEDGTNGEYYDFCCSSCGYCDDIVNPNYCPNCGLEVVG